MNGWPALDRFLQTDPGDVGCAEAMDMLHIYAELARPTSSTPASQRTCARAARAGKTSTGCGPPPGARRHHPPRGGRRAYRRG
jgi:hypothetical protein